MKITKKIYKQIEVGGNFRDKSLTCKGPGAGFGGKKGRKFGFKSVEPRSPTGERILSVNDTMYTDRTGRDLSSQYNFCDRYQFRDTKSVMGNVDIK